MFNEAIEIENEDKAEPERLLTKKEVGRIITEVGTNTMAQKLNETVIESTESDEKNV